jgi:hypothetical protein
MNSILELPPKPNLTFTSIKGTYELQRRVSVFLRFLWQKVVSSVWWVTKQCKDLIYTLNSNPIIRQILHCVQNDSRFQNDIALLHQF